MSRLVRRKAKKIKNFSFGQLPIDDDGGGGGGGGGA